MISYFQIVSSSLRSVWQEITRNKLRSFLSLFGVTIGVFCIISVLATVNSLERNIRNEMEALGRNTIFIDKWEYSATGPDFPYWKFARRPAPAYQELSLLRQRTPAAKEMAFKISRRLPVSYKDLSARVMVYGITRGFHRIQSIDIKTGFYPTEDDFSSGHPVAVIGYEFAESMFGDASLAVGKNLEMGNKSVRITGVIKKQGTQLLGGWGFDESVILPYRFARELMDERKADPLILVSAGDNISQQLLKEELAGAMRGIHKLRPHQENDFALNTISDFSTVLGTAFRSMNIAGWAIGSLSFLVGIFGVANIMFVSVKERTPQTGIKKALGAKRRVILTEFLLEATFLCLMGGVVGLMLVFLLTQIASNMLDFPVFISWPVLSLAFLISVMAGVLSGILPARQAASMNPITAIRS